MYHITLNRVQWNSNNRSLRVTISWFICMNHKRILTYSRVARAHQDGGTCQSPPGRWRLPETTKTVAPSRAHQDGGTSQSPPGRWHLPETTKAVAPSRVHQDGGTPSPHSPPTHCVPWYRRLILALGPAANRKPYESLFEVFARVRMFLEVPHLPTDIQQQYHTP